MTALTIILSGKIRCRVYLPATLAAPSSHAYYDSEDVFLVTCTDAIPGVKVAVQAKYPSEEREPLLVNTGEKMVGMITIVHGDQVHMWPVLESADLYTDVWEL